MSPTELRRRVWGVALALGLASCGGPGATEQGTTSSSVGPATTVTTTATTTIPAITTNTSSTTTTTTLPPLIPVPGWEGEGVRAISVEIEFNYPERTSDILESVSQALRQIDLEPNQGSDVVLRFELEGTPQSAQYMGVGRCYTGARIRGTAHLTTEGMPDLRASVEGSRPTPDLISGCREEAAEAPFDIAFDHALIGTMAALFGPASVPYLADVVFRPESSLVPVDRAMEAIDAFRGLDYDTISIAHQYEFLKAVLSWIHRVDAQGRVVTDPASVAAARLVLLDYSPTDFGFSGEEDLRSWYEWLADWRAEHTGEAVRDGSGVIVSSGTIPVVDLRDGDCFDFWPYSPFITKTETVLGVPCSDAHEGEIYLTFELPNGDYPGDEAWDAAFEQCRDAFEAFVGVDYLSSDLSFFEMTPTAETWEQGDRTVRCRLFSVDYLKLVGSARGTGR